MSSVSRATVARAFRRVALPLVSYYAVTLALPLANGAALSGAFMEHALVVLVVPPIGIVLGCAVHTIALGGGGGDGGDGGDGGHGTRSTRRRGDTGSSLYEITPAVDRLKP